MEQRAVHFYLLADLERAKRELERPRPSRALVRRIHPILLRDRRVTAEDRVPGAALRLHRPTRATVRQTSSGRGHGVWAEIELLTSKARGASRPLEQRSSGGTRRDY